MNRPRVGLDLFMTSILICGRTLVVTLAAQLARSPTRRPFRPGETTLPNPSRHAQRRPFDAIKRHSLRLLIQFRLARCIVICRRHNYELNCELSVKGELN